ncbi:hypothetical protein [Nocardioides sp. L-11A]|uniref:hypothetical protein n=1 Tax=Nocardioides sp. L-11A TaxID=3043848 RepID=UPI002499EEDD|nr:hypothetical protein QJ852_01495 [Nocardioides sp. L-11A]
MTATTGVDSAAAAGPHAPDTVSAHPFGDPQTADITTTAQGVQVRWQAAPDDVTALAMHLGVLAEMRTYVFQDGALVPAESDDSDGVVLAGAPAFATYLLEHVAVTVGGRACTGALEPLADVIAEGATLSFDCGGPVRAADVELDLLVDLHESYRTLATGPTGQRAAYSAAERVHAWTFPAAPAGMTGGNASAADADGSGGAGGSGRSALVQLGGVIGGAVAFLGMILAWRRRRTRTTTVHR